MSPKIFNKIFMDTTNLNLIVFDTVFIVNGLTYHPYICITLAIQNGNFT